MHSQVHFSVRSVPQEDPLTVENNAFSSLYSHSSARRLTLYNPLEVPVGDNMV